MVDVKFRKERDGGIIAVFPSEAGVVGRPDTVAVFTMHGHSYADLGYIRTTRPATRKESEGIRRAMRGYPYRYQYREVARMTRKHTENRYRQTRVCMA